MMCNIRAVFLLIKGYLEIIEFIEIHYAYRIGYKMVEGFKSYGLKYNTELKDQDRSVNTESALESIQDD